MPLELGTVALSSASVEPYRQLLALDEWETFLKIMRQAGMQLHGRTIWNINSTAHGGGVAEMLAWEIPYERGLGMDTRWLVIEGDTQFFSFTKRLHALLHGVAANGSTISEAERTAYERTQARNLELLVDRIRPGDVVILHDPQPAGLIPDLVRHGCRVIWRCHIGVDQPNQIARDAWTFLLPAVRAAHATVFSRPAYVWEGLDRTKVEIIHPAIDAFTPKNQEMDDDTVGAILRATGILLSDSDGSEPSFRRRDGIRGKVTGATDLFPNTRLRADARLVVQVSRWDRLKDPVGVMDGFASFVAPRAEGDLILAGPGASAVADDPEEPAVLREVQDRWQRLPTPVRDRIHLARLPMDDEDENAAVVNALQRRAQVVVQKSLREGFGLTVAEAMWKARPVVASRVGGIQDQIEDRVSGVLIDDPGDLAAFGGAIVELLGHENDAQRLGAAAKARVRREFLAPRLLIQQAQLMASTLRSAE
ncbi:MAG TPA: glycosyltransferase [Candidatus Dormibacteraeota bacterium]|nr:glycosyltransferase [Candidatus Dormibacteraeota bacterium]